MNLGISKFFQDIKNYLSGGSVLGVDIGTTSIKLVELSRKENRFELEDYGILDTRDYLDQSSQALQTSSLEIMESEAARLLEILLKEVEPETETAVFSIPSFSSFVTLIDMPMLSEEETKQSVQYQARQYIPMEISKVSIDWLRVSKYKSDGKKFQKILLIGTPNKMISSLKRVASISGVSIAALELETLALVRAVSRFSSPTLLVDIGSESTSVSVSEGGFLKFTSQSDYGGSNVTRAISKSLGLGMQRSEVLKRKKGLSGSSAGSKLSTLITPFLDVIIQEANRVESIYKRKYRKEIEQVTILGGEAKLSGVESYFSERTGFDYVQPGTLGRVDFKEEIAPIASGLEKRLPVAVGLAEKYFSI
ncbi:MAG: pilus assembly protein PilM [Candidatus Magasanikbacteria bacterium]